MAAESLIGQDLGTNGDVQVLWILWPILPPFFVLSDKLEQNNIVRVPSFLGFSFAARMMLELPSVVDTSVFAVDNRDRKSVV